MTLSNAVRELINVEAFEDLKVSVTMVFVGLNCTDVIDYKLILLSLRYFPAKISFHFDEVRLVNGG